MKHLTILLMLLSLMLPEATYGVEFYSDTFEGTTANPGIFNWAGGTVFERVFSGEGINGTRALRFAYGVGPNNTAEERFYLNNPYRDIWIKYWWRVPPNFSHIERPSGSGIGSNSKFLSIWMDGYSFMGRGPTVVWVLWGGDGDNSELSIHYNPGDHVNPTNQSVTGPQLDTVPFITVPQDRGRWMQIVCHARAATGVGTNDGIIETYRRWENEPTFTRIQRITGADIAAPVTGPNGFKEGYFMGWSNPGYDEPTNFYIDDIQFHDTDPTGITQVLPNSPQSFRIH